MTYAIPIIQGEMNWRKLVSSWMGDHASDLASIKFTKFLSSGTFTPDPKCICGYAVGKGGGSGGGGGVIGPSNAYGTSAGAEGNTVLKFFTAAQVAGGVAVTIGAGSVGSNGSVTSLPGGDTSLGSLLTAKGGGGANQYGPGQAQTAGNVGDQIIYGASGACGMQAPVASGVLAAGGTGGGSGGGLGAQTGTTGASPSGGNALPNSGGGGGGAASYAAGPGNIVGGNAGSGWLYIVEFLSA